MFEQLFPNLAQCGVKIEETRVKIKRSPVDVQIMLPEYGQSVFVPSDSDAVAWAEQLVTRPALVKKPKLRDKKAERAKMAAAAQPEEAPADPAEKQ